MGVHDIRLEAAQQPVKPDGRDGQSQGAAPGLLDCVMRDSVSVEKLDKAAATAGKGDVMPEFGLQAGNVDSNIHDAVADLVAVVCQMQNLHAVRLLRTGTNAAGMAKRLAPTPHSRSYVETQ